MGGGAGSRGAVGYHAGMRTRRSGHRIAAILVALPLLLWTATGLLFLYKPGWGPAYEPLSVARSEGQLSLESLVAPGALATLRGAGRGAVRRVELWPTVSGPVYRIERGAGVLLVDAATGAVLSPLGESLGRRWVEDAVSRSAHPASYGEVREVTLEGGQLHVDYVSGARVSLNRQDGKLRRGGPDRRRIDWLYRVHYLQWTGVEGLDRALALGAIAATWVTTLLGVLLWRRPRRPSG